MNITTRVGVKSVYHFRQGTRQYESRNPDLEGVGSTFCRFIRSEVGDGSED